MFLPSFRFTSPRIVSGVFSYGSSANLKPKFSFTLVLVDLRLFTLLRGWKAYVHETHNTTIMAMIVLDILMNQQLISLARTVGPYV